MPANRLTSPIRKYSLSGISRTSFSAACSNILRSFYQRPLSLTLVTTKRPPHSSPRSSPPEGKRSTGILAGVHPVREAFRAGRTLDRILIARGAGGPRIREIVDLAREHSVPVRFEPRDA